MGVSVHEFVRVHACGVRACNASASACSCASNMIRKSNCLCLIIVCDHTIKPTIGDIKTIMLLILVT